MVKRISNVPFHLPNNELQLRCFSCFVYKQMCITSICILTYMLAHGDLHEVWERATPFITGAGLFESRLTLTFNIIFSCLEMFFTSNVWCSLTLLQLETTEHLTKK